MASTHDGTQPRFQVDLVGTRGRIVSSSRTDSEDEAARSFVELAKTDFGRELGVGSYVALADQMRILDAAKTHEGHGVYNMRFLRGEGRAAYEAIQPSPLGVRYPVDITEPMSKTASERLQQRRQALERAAPAISTAGANEITAHRLQPDDDSRTAALRKQVMERLVVGRSEPPAIHTNENVERDGAPSRRAVEPSAGNDDPKAARDILAHANQAELAAYAAARPRSSDVAQQLLDAAQKRIESELEAPSGVRRSRPPLEDRFNVVEEPGSRAYHFRDQPGKVAFTERWLSMTTALDHAAVAKAMVDRAEERGWSGMRVAGSEEFKRQAWIAAEARGIKAVGHEPTQSDRAVAKQEELRLAKDPKERPGRAVQRQEAATGGTITRQGERRPAGNAGRFQENGHDRETGQSNHGAAARSYGPVMRELERAMTLKGVPDAQKDRARVAVQRELNALAVEDKAAKVKLYDPASSRQAPRTASRPRLQRAQPDIAR